MIVQQKKQYCDVSGHKLAYQRSGEGETILLVHGITTYAFIWRRIIPILQDQYDVIAIDLLGCGDSDKPLDSSYSIKHHAELLHLFVNSLGIERFHFVGHDVGGGIGQIYAVRYPEQLYDLTLINTIAYDFWPVQPIIAMRTPIIRQFMMATLEFGALKQIIMRGVYHNEHVDSELVNLFWKPLRTSRGRKAFLQFARSLDNRHLMEIERDLKAIELPVMIIRGDADVYLSSAIAERLHNEIPSSHLVRIATGGHFIQEDEPEELVDHITHFFNEKSYANR